jgi:uncharacterized LabA/DUF88 family protein
LKTHRICIFIDYDNFTSRLSSFLDLDEENIDIWSTFNDKIINFISTSFPSLGKEIQHEGTFLCIGISDQIVIPELAKQELKIVKEFEKINQNLGFIVKYGNRTAPYKDKKTGKYKLGKEKGVDAEIICEMFMGAHLDSYDIAILFSDDNDYLPVITRVQGHFSKKIIQAGFLPNSKVRSEAYGHIKLENTYKEIFH